MCAYTLTHLEDHELVSNLKTLLARSHGITAVILAHLAEVEARRIHLAAGYSSMHAYCVQELGLSDDAANKRIHAARAARMHPEIFPAVADGRLHLTAVNLLAPYLTTGNTDDLIAVATRRTRREIEELLAARFPKTEFLPLVEVMSGSAGIAAGARTNELVPERSVAVSSATTSPIELAPERVNLTTPAVAVAQIPRSAVKPHAMDRFALRLVLERATYEKLRRAQEYLAHAIPDGDVARVFDRALDQLLAALEKQKFAATNRPRPGSKRESKNPRHIPAHVKREVWRRDHGQCSFVSENGQRCSARRHLEFDHEEPVARGGESKVSNLRLRCRAHNQYEAERIFGAQFMSDKRHAARPAENREST